MTDKYFELEIDTITGPKKIPAPLGEYDETAKTVWLWMLNTRAKYDDLKGTKIAKKKLEAIEAQLEILGIVLGNAVGMSSSYWTMEAKRLQPVAAEMQREARLAKRGF